MTGTHKTLHASLATLDSSPHSQADRPMVGVREARPCPTFSLNSAEKPPKNTFSRQNCRHNGVDAEPKTFQLAGFSLMEPAGIEPATSCLQRARGAIFLLAGFRFSL
jgi:hypothetical protein